MDWQAGLLMQVAHRLEQALERAHDGQVEQGLVAEQAAPASPPVSPPVEPVGKLQLAPRAATRRRVDAQRMGGA
jgi:hypothetical protein